MSVLVPGSESDGGAGPSATGRGGGLRVGDGGDGGDGGWAGAGLEGKAPQSGPRSGLGWSGGDGGRWQMWL